MRDIHISAVSTLTESDITSASEKMGRHFGRLDLASKLAVLAVEALGIALSSFPPNRVAICLATNAGSLSTDVDYWSERDPTSGPSPMLFAYTLPSAGVGEVAIRNKLTGPNLCFVGDEECAIVESRDLLNRGEADACLCLFSEIVTPKLADMTGLEPAMETRAVFLQTNTVAGPVLSENDRDMNSLFAKFRA